MKTTVLSPAAGSRLGDRPLTLLAPTSARSSASRMIAASVTPRCRARRFSIRSWRWSRYTCLRIMVAMDLGRYTSYHTSSAPGGLHAKTGARRYGLRTSARSSFASNRSMRSSSIFLPSGPRPQALAAIALQRPGCPLHTAHCSLSLSRFFGDVRLTSFFRLTGLPAVSRIGAPHSFISVLRTDPMPAEGKVGGTLTAAPALGCLGGADR